MKKIILSLIVATTLFTSVANGQSSNLPYTQRGGYPHDLCQFVERQQGQAFRAVSRILGDTVSAAQITTIRYRHSQVADGPLVFVPDGHWPTSLKGDSVTPAARLSSKTRRRVVWKR